jgi:hypothetical protein
VTPHETPADRAEHGDGDDTLTGRKMIDGLPRDPLLPDAPRAIDEEDGEPFLTDLSDDDDVLGASDDDDG